MGTETVTLINAVRIDDSPTSYTSRWVDVGGFGKMSLALNTTKTGAPTNVTYTVESNIGATKLATDADGNVGPSDGTAVALDVLLATGGSDAPVASVVATATAAAWLTFPPGFVTKWLRVKAVGAGTTGAAYFDCTAVLFGQG